MYPVAPAMTFVDMVMVLRRGENAIDNGALQRAIKKKQTVFIIVIGGRISDTEGDQQGL
jgi:hypothetical protein